MTTRTTPVRPWTERLRADTRHTLREIRRHRAHYAFMAPYAVLFIAFTLLPCLAPPSNVLFITRMLPPS